MRRAEPAELMWGKGCEPRPLSLNSPTHLQLQWADMPHACTLRAGHPASRTLKRAPRTLHPVCTLHASHTPTIHPPPKLQGRHAARVHPARRQGPARARGRHRGLQAGPQPNHGAWLARGGGAPRAVRHLGRLWPWHAAWAAPGGHGVRAPCLGGGKALSTTVALSQEASHYDCGAVPGGEPLRLWRCPRRRAITTVVLSQEASHCGAVPGG